MADEGAFREAVLRHAQNGSALLAPVLTAAGFEDPELTLARGSGGPAAVAVWRRPDGMRVETHVRDSLGIVRYSWHDDGLLHQDYLRLTGERGQYPGFSDRPEEAFGHLAADLHGPVRPRNCCPCRRRTSARSFWR